MRQYKILYKRLGAARFAQLEPIVHAPMYNQPEIRDAIEHMRVNPRVEGMALRFEGEIINIISFDQEAEAPNSFKFVDPPCEAGTGCCKVASVAEAETVPKTNA